MGGVFSLKLPPFIVFNQITMQNARRPVCLLLHVSDLHVLLLNLL